MKIYNYNACGIYTSTNEAVKVKGDYIIPANATNKEPQKEKEGYTSVYSEEKEAWEQVVDKRGKKVWSKETKQEVEIDYLGEIREGFTDEKPEEFDEWIEGKWVVNDVKKIAATKKEIESIVSQHIRKQAQSMQYDDENSIATYAAVENPFQIEAIKFIKWKAGCWKILIEHEQTETLSVNTEIDEAEIIALLPEYSDYE